MAALITHGFLFAVLLPLCSAVAIGWAWAGGQLVRALAIDAASGQLVRYSYRAHALPIRYKLALLARAGVLLAAFRN